MLFSLSLSRFIYIYMYVYIYKVVILYYNTFRVLSNLIIKQLEHSRLDEDHLIVETRWGTEDFILD